MGKRESPFNVSGLRSQFNDFILDGVDNNAYGTSNQGLSNQVIQAARLAFDAFNALNRVNYAGYVGNLSSPFFGQPIPALPGRRLQLMARFKF